MPALIAKQETESRSVCQRSAGRPHLGYQKLSLALAAAVILSATAAESNLATDSTQFTGNVAASCLLEATDAQQLNLFPNGKLESFADFHLTANTPVRLSLTAVTRNQEPADVPGGAIVMSYIYKQQTGAPHIRIGDQATLTSAMEPASAENGMERTLYKVGLKAITGQQSEGKYLLPPGDYSYTTTIQCLL